MDSPSRVFHSLNKRIRRWFEAIPVGELNRLDSSCGDIHRGRNSECGEKLLADQGNGVSGIRPLVRTRLCQSLWPIPVLVPFVFLGFQVCV
jgi:hypothetical protein